VTGAVCVLLCLLVLAPSAAASTYDGQTEAPAFVQGLALKADRFWHARDVPSCASTRPVLTAPSLEDADGVQAQARGASFDREDGCTVWLLQSEVSVVADPGLYGAEARLCALVFHEAGHTGGLGHSERGLMSPDAETVPFECRTWARRWQARKWRRSWR
jgi:hypothetical protein